MPVERTWDAESVFATTAPGTSELEAVARGPSRAGGVRRPARRGAVGDDRRARGSGRADTARWATSSSTPISTTRSRPRTRKQSRASVVRSRSYGQVLASGGLRRARAARDRARPPRSSGPRSEPALAPYGHYLDDLFRRGEHVRSVGGRGAARHARRRARGSVRASTAGSSTATSTSLPASGASGESAEVTQGSLEALLGSPDRVLRRSAWESYADGYRSVRNALAVNYATAIKQDVFSARARRHESTRSASLSASNIPLEVFDNLLATFERNLPTWHRYWRVRAAAGRSRRAAAVRPLGAARRRSVARSRTSSAWSGSASRSPRSATSTSRPSAAAPSRSAGSTSIPTRGRWAARSPPARRARIRSSS